MTQLEYIIIVAAHGINVAILLAGLARAKSSHATVWHEIKCNFEGMFILDFFFHLRIQYHKYVVYSPAQLCATDDRISNVKVKLPRLNTPACEMVEPVLTTKLNNLVVEIH